MLKSFGRVTVTAAGTPVRATNNVAAAVGGPSARQGVQSFMIQADPANTGILYVFAGGDNFAGDHRTDGLGLVAIIPAPASATTGPFTTASFGMPNVPAGLNLNDIWIDTSVNGSRAIVSALV